MKAKKYGMGEPRKKMVICLDRKRHIGMGKRRTNKRQVERRRKRKIGKGINT